MLVLSGVKSVSGADQKLTLMFGGKVCEAYLGKVESTLKNLAGVKAVGFKNMKGHAIVSVEGNKTTANQLVQAVNGVKADRWRSSAEVMK